MNYTTKRFYFSDQTGNVISDELPIGLAMAIIRELKQRGFHYCYSVWVS